MWAFKAYFKKEFMESNRQYKYVMLAVGIIVFALFDPLMLKLVPSILKNQLPADLSALFVITQKSAVQSYIKDLNQIGLLFVTFVFCSTLCDEIYNYKLVFPYSKGASPASIVIAKILNYSLFVWIFTIVGFLLNYYYVTILFSKDPLDISNILPSIVLVCIYYSFNISVALLFSSLFKRGLVGGIIVLALSITTSTLSGIKGLGKFIPYKLINTANQFTFYNCGFTIIFTIIITILLVSVTIVRMNKVEVI